MLTRALLVIIVLVLAWQCYAREGFESRGEKARAIVDWFGRVGTPTYDRYRRDLNRQSNIVEYEDALKLFQDRNLTVETVTDVL
jgi:hypothetical protein